MKYKDFNIYVSPYELNDWGLTYRRIAPGYEVYGKLGIYQRNLSNFEETAILENTAAPGACLNCHTANRTNPDQFTFHVRGDHGATLVSQNGKREWLKAKNDSLKGSMVYPYWHPSGKYCAYSTNTTHQSFHAVKDERIEVFDQASDVFVYEPATHELILDSLLMTKDHYETYPVFSPDGKTLYFCSSTAEPIPSGYKDIKYNICKIGFDAATGKFGNQVDTIFNARELGKSATHPRPSYDGRYIMFTMSDYGCFPIWHKEADNWLLDLKTGQAKPLLQPIVRIRTVGTTGARIPIGLSLHPAVATDSIPVFTLPALMIRAMLASHSCCHSAIRRSTTMSCWIPIIPQISHPSL